MLHLRELQLAGRKPDAQLTFCGEDARALCVLCGLRRVALHGFHYTPEHSQLLVASAVTRQAATAGRMLSYGSAKRVRTLRHIQVHHTVAGRRRPCAAMVSGLSYV